MRVSVLSPIFSLKWQYESMVNIINPILNVSILLGQTWPLKWSLIIFIARIDTYVFGTLRNNNTNSCFLNHELMNWPCSWYHPTTYIQTKRIMPINNFIQLHQTLHLVVVHSQVKSYHYIANHILISSRSFFVRFFI